MGDNLTEKASQMGRKLKLQGSVGFWAGAFVLMVVGLVLWMLAKPVASKIEGKVRSGLGRAKEAVTGTPASPAASDPLMGGL